MKSLWGFKGGVKLSGHKQLSSNAPIKPGPIPEKVYIPLRQHIGEVAQPIVEVGDYVYKGQLVASAQSFISAPVHASTSGHVHAIEKHTIPHPSGIREQCIVIETDGKDQWDPNILDYQSPVNPTEEELRRIIRNAGIVGLGGAVFPSAAKLKPTRTIDTLIINGVECEPYITCDDVLMRHRPEQIIEGVLLLRKILKPQECIIAIEDNKPEAIAALDSSLAEFRKKNVGQVNEIRVQAVPTIFPAGGEKQLIKVLTNKEVPQQGLPYEVGVVCINVGTTEAIFKAVKKGQPLVNRLVTVTGEEVAAPGNFEVLIGTPVESLLNHAGGVKSKSIELVMGGPMMGYNLPDKSVPVVKASNCILVKSEAKQAPTSTMPCIRCGSCASACPVRLLPQQLYWHARGKHFEKLQHYNLADCIECGCCAVVCPSKIPLVQYFRYAKTELKEHEVKTQFASQSRLRMQAREARLERMKQEQEARKAERRAARQKKKQAKESTSQAATQQTLTQSDGKPEQSKQVSNG